MAERSLTHTAYQSALDDLSSSAITDRERAVIDTMTTPGWKVIEDLWDHRERSLTEQLVRLTPGTSADKYAAAVAVIRGLQEAREAPRALSKVAERKRHEALEEQHA